MHSHTCYRAHIFLFSLCYWFLLYLFFYYFLNCLLCSIFFFFFFSSRRRHTRFDCDWSSDVCSSDLPCSLGARRRAAKRAGLQQLGDGCKAGLVSYPFPAFLCHSQPLQFVRTCEHSEIGRASCRERV